MVVGMVWNLKTKTKHRADFLAGKNKLQKSFHRHMHGNLSMCNPTILFLLTALCIGRARAALKNAKASFWPPEVKLLCCVWCLFTGQWKMSCHVLKAEFIHSSYLLFPTWRTHCEWGQESNPFYYGLKNNLAPFSIDGNEATQAKTVKRIQ